MTFPFKQIPPGIRVPLFYAELDASRANTSAQAQRALLVGPMVAAGAAIAGLPVLVQSLGAAKQLAGAGSLLAAMAEAYRDNDSFGEVWLLPIADDGAAVAATGALTFTGLTTAPGTLSLYIAGQLLAVALAGGQTAAQVAATVAAAINGVPDLPVSAGVAAGVVTLTADNKGATGNDIDLRANYRGAPAGEAMPAGLAVAIVAMAGGAGGPALAGALAALADQPFDFIASAFTDAASTAAVKALLNDATGRWSWSRQVFGHAFYGLRGTTGTLGAWGAALNDQHQTAIGYADSPTPPWVWGAALAGAAATSLRADPGLPLQTLVLADVLPPPVQSRFTLTIRNSLLYSGISTFAVTPSGDVALENVVTTYVTNAAGQPDNSYLEVETLFLLAYVLRRLAAVVSTKYARVKLAADGVRLTPGSNVVTPGIIKADIIACYRQLEAEGMVQQSDVFAANLVVQKDAQNPNRINVLWPGTLINQLRVFALLAQFRLN